jgi:hypothetical protein
MSFSNADACNLCPIPREELVNIKRNNKKSKKESLSLETISDGGKEENISIDHELNKNVALTDYRNYVKGKIKDIFDLLKKMEENHPNLK